MWRRRCPVADLWSVQKPGVAGKERDAGKPRVDDMDRALVFLR